MCYISFVYYLTTSELNGLYVSCSMYCTTLSLSVASSPKIHISTFFIFDVVIYDSQDLIASGGAESSLYTFLHLPQEDTLFHRHMKLFAQIRGLSYLYGILFIGEDRLACFPSGIWCFVQLVPWNLCIPHTSGKTAWNYIVVESKPDLFRPILADYTAMYSSSRTSNRLLSIFHRFLWLVRKFGIQDYFHYFGLDLGKRSQGRTIQAQFDDIAEDLDGNVQKTPLLLCVCKHIWFFCSCS